MNHSEADEGLESLQSGDLRRFDNLSRHQRVTRTTGGITVLTDRFKDMDGGAAGSGPTAPCLSSLMPGPIVRAMPDAMADARIVRAMADAMADRGR